MEPLTLTMIAATSHADHSGTLPLVAVGAVLLVAAAVVRRVIRLALLVALAGAVALVVAAWHGGLIAG